MSYQIRSRGKELWNGSENGRGVVITIAGQLPSGRLIVVSNPTRKGKI